MKMDSEHYDTWQSQGCGSAFISADPDPADFLNADLDLAAF